MFHIQSSNSFQNGFPRVSVKDIETYPSSNKIIAGTFGRGLWSSTLPTTCPPIENLTFANDPSNPNYTGYQRYETSDSIISSRIITGGIGTDVKYKAANTILLQEGFHGKYNNSFEAKLGPCGTFPPSIPVTSKINLSGRFVGTLGESEAVQNE